MNVELTDDPVRFLAAAGPLLLADEARHNLALGLAETMRDAPGVYPDRRLWIVRDGDEVAGAAGRTPPYGLVLAKPRSTGVLDALVAAVTDELPGAVGGVPEIDEFAGRWSQRRDVTARRAVDQGLYALEAVSDVARPEGAMRDAGAHDLELLVDWFDAFAAEALHGAVPGEDARAVIERRFATAGAGIVLWEDDGRPVSLAAFSGRTPNGIRIGPVYTPPELRGHGYATALVADVSARLLASGRRFCFLYTDLANPTANAIYERIGYRRVCESAQIAFEPR